jgi:hypothetical protein
MLVFVEAESNAPPWYSRMLTPDEFRHFVTEALAGERHKKAWIGAVKPDAAGRIRAVCGKTVSKIMVESDTIWHSYKDINGVLIFAEEVRVNFGGWLTLVTCYRQKKAK